MTRQDFLENYIGAFNRGDFDSFTSFYDEQVELNLGGRMMLRGRQAIRDFYTAVFEKVRETLEVKQLVMDGEGVACIIATEFRALEDWPDFIAGPIREGEAIHIESFIFYTVGPTGTFTAIRTTRSTG